LQIAANVFLVEEMERGETDVGHFFIAKQEALIGRDVVGSWSSGSRGGGCGCAPRQRKSQSDRAQRRHGGGLCRTPFLRSLVYPWHVASSVKLL
jgi:hypothetical protein